MITFVVYGTLFFTTTLYAILLDRSRGKGIEPDYTWTEVVIGTALCLLAAGVYVRLLPNATWQDYESAVWGAFMVGGVPIIIWQIYRAIERNHDVLRAEAKRREYEQNTISLADKCRPGATRDDSGL